MALDVESNAREIAGQMLSLRRQLVQGPIALGVAEYATRIAVRARTRGYGFTDRTGTLRSSIRTGRVMVQGDVATATIGSNVVYSRYVEYVSNDRFSYLRRALEEEGPEQLRRSIDRHVGPWIRRNGFGP